MCEAVTGRRAAEQAGPDGTAQQGGALLLHLLRVQLPQQAETAMPREVQSLLLPPWGVTEQETGSIPPLRLGSHIHRQAAAIALQFLHQHQPSQGR